MRDLLRVLLRISAVTLIEALAVYLMALLVPGLSITGSTLQQAAAAVTIAVVLSLLNALIRPLIVFAGLPIHLYTVGLFTLVVNSGILFVSAYVLPNVQLAGIVSAIVGTLVLAVVNTFITGLISIDQDYAYFDGVVEWLGRRNLEPGDRTISRGLVLLEIDGLSFQRALQAMADGYLPVMKQLVSGGTHKIAHIDCGLPSQSSSCQAGIMYGDNYDIPGFRWYLKEESRLVVSNNLNDAAEINQRFFNGNGLLRDGTSVNNLLSGEAKRSLMTISTLLDNRGEDTPHSGYDLTLVFLNPYLLSRAVVLTFWDLAVELYQAWRQRIRDVQPRVNRLNRFYPFLRASLNVFIRDVGTNAVILDVMRGSPAIYMTFMGYDEIAHHAGPDSTDALNSLKGFDRALARMLDVIERKAPRPYDLFILSDHGQSFGATFYQRSGYTIGELLERLAQGKSYVASMSDSENVRGQVAAVLREMERLSGLGGRDKARAEVLSRAGRSLGRRVQPVERSVPADTDMLVLAGGNLANVYFPQIPGKITMPELEQMHPGLLESLVAHPDIGLVIVQTEDGQPWVIGKDGARNLSDGTITGSQDPLLVYGDPHLRASQLGRLASFPSAGDLIIISAIYSDGQIAAFEELVGSHGGLGGQQTDAFLLHPADFEVLPTANTTELFPLLNNRRGLPVAASNPHSVAIRAQPWSWPVMKTGIADWQGLLDRAARSLRLDRTLFSEVANDPYATGQAAFIALVLALGSIVVAALSVLAFHTNSAMIVSGIIILLVGLALCLLIAALTGRLYHGVFSFTRTFNALAFAGVGGFVAWFAPINYAGPLLLITGTLIVVVASWLAIQGALGISRWKAVLIPLASFTLAALVLAAVDQLFTVP